MHIAEEPILPCQPRILALLMRELLSDMPHMRRVSQLFGCDPVLAAQLMESANASANPMSAWVRGIPQAITLLSTRQLQALLKKAQAGVSLRARVGMDMAQFAGTSHACAKRARSLAGLTGVDVSAAYVAALLHGMGQVYVHQMHPERTAALNKTMDVWDPRRPRLEMRHWGYSANSATVALLRRWNLPADIIAAIKAMEAPLDGQAFDPMAGVLHLAVWCSRAKQSGWSERTMADAFPVDVALALGVDVDVVLQQDAIDWSQSLY